MPHQKVLKLLEPKNNYVKIANTSWGRKKEKVPKLK
jgi:hypothetical protein